MRNQAGIQQLIAAERQAQSIINDARNAKLARLKHAQEEADNETGEFGSHNNREFQKKVEGSTGDSSSNVKRLEQETDAKIYHLKTEAARISQDVVNMLLKHATIVKT